MPTMTSLALLVLTAAPLARSYEAILYVRSGDAIGASLWARYPHGSYQIGLVNSRLSLVATISPNRRWVAFVAESKLHVAALETQRIAIGVGTYRYVFKCAATRASAEGWGGAVRFAVGVSGTPRWSPDSSKIAFVKQVRTNGYGDITVAAVNSLGGLGATTQLTNRTGTEHGDFSPTWSGDGSRVLYCSHTLSGYKVLSIPVAGGATSEIPLPDGIKSNLDVSKDGRRVAFRLQVLDPASNGAYTAGIDGSGAARLANTLADDSNPQFSPDGSKVYVRRLVGRASDAFAWDTYALPVSGSAASRIVGEVGVSEIPMQATTLVEP